MTDRVSSFWLLLLPASLNRGSYCTSSLARRSLCVLFSDVSQELALRKVYKRGREDSPIHDVGESSTALVLAGYHSDLETIPGPADVLAGREQRHVRKVRRTSIVDMDTGVDRLAIATFNTAQESVVPVEEITIIAIDGNSSTTCETKCAFGREEV